MLAKNVGAGGTLARVLTGQQRNPLPKLLSTTSVVEGCQQPYHQVDLEENEGGRRSSGVRVEI